MRDLLIVFLTIINLFYGVQLRKYKYLLEETPTLAREALVSGLKIKIIAQEFEKKYLHCLEVNTREHKGTK